MPTFSKHGHGGQLSQASEHYGIPLSKWIDLSTGISPFVYPLSNVPDECWQRLPENNDGLETAAANYYGSEYLLPVSGSQEAIQKLPFLFSATGASLTIGIMTPAYHSHQQAWRKAGHNIVLLSPDEIDDAVSTPHSSQSSTETSLDILLLVNPTNPSSHLYSRDDLFRWHKELASRDGCLIIDEAFIDQTPEQSLIESKPKAGLIVLRSIGKFFGLAGIRLGFVWAETHLLKRLALSQDDWSVSHPARWAGKIALADKLWHHSQRKRLNEHSLRLEQLLSRFIKHYDAKILPKSGEVASTEAVRYTCLFSYIEHPDSPFIHKALAKQGILTRLFKQSDRDGHHENALRFGLPSNEAQWQRLEKSLNQVVSSL